MITEAKDMLDNQYATQNDIKGITEVLGIEIIRANIALMQVDTDALELAIAEAKSLHIFIEDLLIVFEVCGVCLFCLFNIPDICEDNIDLVLIHSRLETNIKDAEVVLNLPINQTLVDDAVKALNEAIAAALLVLNT